MGCDIHSYAEVRTDGVWRAVTDKVFRTDRYATERGEPYTDRPFDCRNYTMFGLFAGVRGHNVAPISQPRGVPDDVSAEVREGLDAGEYRQATGNKTWYHDSSLHSHSWLTLAELLAVDYDQTVDHGQYGPAPLRDHLGGWYFDQLEDLAALGAPEDVRIVFGFDS